jgi:hypothetical protein
MIRQMRVATLSTSLVGLGASLLPSLSFGLGLGDIQVQSRLNQPLYARIEVVDVSEEEWHQIRARIAPRTLMSDGAAHPEILASLTLRAVEDAHHGHFIEVKTGEVLTEPLFDLPVEVAGQSLQLVRSYSVLLDPAMSEDAPGGQPDALLAQGAGDRAAKSASEYPGPPAVVAQVDAQIDAQAHVAPHHRGQGARTHSDAAPSRPTTASKTAAQEGLAGQPGTLQPSLLKMQSTIAAQDAEIARLTAQIGARNASQPSQGPSTWVEYPARKSGLSAEEASDARSGWFTARSAMFYWIVGAVVGSIVLTLGVVTFLRWRHAKMLRQIALNEAARRQAPPKPALAPTSEQELLAWQSKLRAAQSGIRKQSLEDTFETPGAGSAQAPAAPAMASEDTVATTVAIEELTQGLGADLESLNASYEAEILQSDAGGGMAAWAAQNEMLERDFLSDTHALPYVLETGNQAKSIDPEGEPLAAGRAGSRNREVVEMLEQSLDVEPDRVDIQLELLEMYHHEALGNRDNFDSLLRKLAVSQQLSPGQQLHLEMLQRTLHDGKSASDSDFVAEVAL